jgi:hypothetical protein
VTSPQLYLLLDIICASPTGQYMLSEDYFLYPSSTSHIGLIARTAKLADLVGKMQSLISFHVFKE